MIRYICALFVGLILACSARAVSPVKEFNFGRSDNDGGVSLIGFTVEVTGDPDAFNDVRKIDITIDGAPATAKELKEKVRKGTQYSICDTADHVALFTTHYSPDGKAYYRDPNDATYKETPYRGPRVLFPVEEPKPATITDKDGNVYTLIGGEYIAGVSSGCDCCKGGCKCYPPSYRQQPQTVLPPAPLAYPSCPNGRCPNK